ncbi:alanine racemase [Halalkalibacterium ligniniphilum]|uniref:alanine racemase n=1 Tax=Halalkalibacterium ligniniphilum TaxID=1134413 RepID=UPI0003458A59|nr:alanine racemase [Halalkalibacterium ligniniphilum]
MVVGEATQSFFRDTWVEVDLSAIEDNIRGVKELYQDKEMTIMAIVKADGYGHGALEVSRAALDAGATFLGVALLDEALKLRKGGIDAPILVLGRTRPTDVQLAVMHNISLTVYQLDWVEEAQKHLQPTDTLKVHMKLDSGMGRIGLREKKEIDEIIEALSASNTIKLEAIFTHFATADEQDLRYFQEQYQRFLTMLEWIQAKGITVPYIHCGNSATALRFPDKTFNMIRFGISMYGLTPSLEIKAELPFQLKQAFSLRCRLTHVKKLPAGEAISYGATYRTTEDEWIGTLPIGYADGWLRYHASNGGYVLVEGEEAPFVGRICMDQCMVRLPKKFDVDTVVTLIGKDKGNEISMDDVAVRLNTINYEIPCVIGPRVPRTYYRQKELVSVKNIK